MALELTSFDGVELNGSSIYSVILPASKGGPRYSVNTSLRERSGLPPTEDDFSYSELTLECLVYQNGTTYTTEEFSDLVHKLFAWRYRVVVGATNETGAVQFVATVREFYRKENAPLLFCLVLEVTDPITTATSQTVSTTSPVTVAGPVRALPVVRVSPTSISANPSYRRVTITDAAGYGLSNYIVRITFDSTGASAAAYTDYLVFVNGQSVPFRLGTPDNASTTVDVGINVPPGGVTYVDIIYGGVVANTVTADDGSQSIFDDRGMNLGGASWSNTNWLWDDFRLSLNPDAPGAWRLGKLGQTIEGVSFGVVDEGQYGISFGLRPNNTLSNDADCMILTVGSRAAATSALADLQRVLTISAGSAQAFIKYRTRGMSRWELAWNTQSSTGTTGPTTLNETLDDTETGVDVVDASGIAVGRVVRVDSEDMYVVSKATNTLNVVRGFNGTTPASHALGSVNLLDVYADVDLDDAVQIAVGIQPLDASANATLGLSNESAFGLALLGNPTVTVGARSDAYRVDGDLRNARNLARIEFDDVYVGGSGALIIDTALKRIRTAGDIFYAGNILFTDHDGWWPLEPGDNAWAGPSGMTVEIHHRDRAFVT